MEAENAPEWLIAEDWALLQAIREILELPLNLTVSHSFHQAIIYVTFHLPNTAESGIAYPITF